MSRFPLFGPDWLSENLSTDGYHSWSLRMRKWKIDSDVRLERYEDQSTGTSICLIENNTQSRINSTVPFFRKCNHEELRRVFLLFCMTVFHWSFFFFSFFFSFFLFSFFFFLFFFFSFFLMSVLIFIIIFYLFFYFPGMCS